MTTKKTGYRIPKDRIGCRFAHIDFDLVPIPFGSGNCQMPCFECTYEGDTPIPDAMVCEEDSRCPAYQPLETKICPMHDEEYLAREWCGSCRPEGDES